MTSTNLEDDRNNNNNKEHVEIEDNEDDNEDAVISSGPASPQRRRLLSPQPFRRPQSPMVMTAAAPLDFSLSPAAGHSSIATATPLAVAVQESIYESVAKVCFDRLQIIIT